MSLWDEKEAKIMYQKLNFYNFLIEKPKITGLRNTDLLREFNFYGELNIMQISKAFGWYARSYKVEIVDSKDPLAQLKTCKSSIKDLFKNLLNEIKGFKYHITVKVLMGKHNQNGDIEFSPVYFNSTSKTIFNSGKYGLDKSFHKILYGIDNWINEGSCQVIESIDAEHVKNFCLWSIIR